MRTKILGTAVAAVVLTASAYATPIFTLGDNPQPGEENITFHTVVQGMTIFGTTVRSSTQVVFSSINTVLHAKGGQSDIDSLSPDKLIHEIMITVPGHTFTDAIFNPFKDVSDKDLHITVVADGVTQPTFTYGKKNGQNFLTITTAGGEKINSVDIVSDDGFSDLRQPRLSGISGIVLTPEPSSLLLLGSGVLGLAQVLRRKLL